MKEQQLRMLNDQNVQLLRNLDRVEEDANAIQLEKVAPNPTTERCAMRTFAY